MNERLKELAREAWLYAVERRTLTDGNHDDFLNFQEEKFAELIIRECIRVSDDLYQGSERLDNNDAVHYHDVDVGEELAKHFGVEA